MVSLLLSQISLFLYLAASVFRISMLGFFTPVAFACIVAFVGNTFPHAKSTGYFMKLHYCLKLWESTYNKNWSNNVSSFLGLSMSSLHCLSFYLLTICKLSSPLIEYISVLLFTYLPFFSCHITVVLKNTNKPRLLLDRYNVILVWGEKPP